MIKLYENIRNLRKENQWTQEELAQKMGYTDRSMIAKIESGKVDLSQSKIIEFAKIFNVDPGDLMGWQDPADSNGTNATTKSNDYYLDEETAREAQRVFNDPDTRMLFDAAKNSKPENIRLAAEMLKRFKETNPDG